jgi:hypothetical protein
LGIKLICGMVDLSKEPLNKQLVNYLPKRKFQIPEISTIQTKATDQLISNSWFHTPGLTNFFHNSTICKFYKISKYKFV